MFPRAGSLPSSPHCPGETRETNLFSKSLLPSSKKDFSNRKTATDCGFSARCNADARNAIAPRRLLNSRGRWRRWLTQVPKMLQQIWTEVPRNPFGFQTRAPIKPWRGGPSGEQERGFPACWRDGGVVRHSAGPGGVPPTDSIARGGSAELGSSAPRLAWEGNPEAAQEIPGKAGALFGVTMRGGGAPSPPLETRPSARRRFPSGQQRAPGAAGPVRRGGGQPSARKPRKGSWEAQRPLFPLPPGTLAARRVQWEGRGPPLGARIGRRDRRLALLAAPRKVSRSAAARGPARALALARSMRSPRAAAAWPPGPP